jgi:hypothetical protein
VYDVNQKFNINLENLAKKFATGKKKKEVKPKEQISFSKVTFDYISIGTNIYFRKFLELHYLPSNRTG